MQKPNFFPFQTLGLTLLLFLVTTALYSQSPLGIPYQAVVRNVDGSVMSNAAVNMIFKIHDGTASGSVVYEESHALTSNAQGLVSCVVGNGVVSQGNFGNVQWGSGAKFLQVLMGNTDLGTQQMMSVPYALYSDGVGVRASATGDTLTIGGNSVIVPGISAANPTSNGGLGSQVLPGNTTCANQNISVTGCGGQTSLTYDGRTYDLVEIGGQCWFADNLATDQYRNGDLIPTGLDNTTWQNTTAGAYAIYNNDPANDVTYGKLYNNYIITDIRGLCPLGWHVPTDCEWMYLEGSLGMSPEDQEANGWRGTNVGGALKITNYWQYPNIGGTNSSGFSAKPGGARIFNGSYLYLGGEGSWWAALPNKLPGIRQLDSEFSTILRNATYVSGSNVSYRGVSVRCLKD